VESGEWEEEEEEWWTREEGLKRGSRERRCRAKRKRRGERK
jgi:hypothetical protein